MIRLPAMLAILATAALLAATAASAATDPRKCGTATPGDSSQHAYWCAHNAAVAAARAKMAAVTHQTRWYAQTACTKAGSLLTWNCLTILASQQTHLTVRFKARASGWAQIVTVLP